MFIVVASAPRPSTVAGMLFLTPSMPSGSSARFRLHRYKDGQQVQPSERVKLVHPKDSPSYALVVDKAKVEDGSVVQAKVKAPARSLVSIDDVGVATAFLAHDAARLLTGETLYVDGGYHIID